MYTFIQIKMIKVDRKDRLQKMYYFKEMLLFFFFFFLLYSKNAENVLSSATIFNIDNN